MAFDTTDIVISIIKIAVILTAMLSVTPFWVWVERRGSALIQDRLGPNRVGPFGLMQAMIDALKFIVKEDMLPQQAHKWLYTIAPMFGLVPALTTISVVPWGRSFVIPAAASWSGALGVGLIAAGVIVIVAGLVTWGATRAYARRSPHMIFNRVIGYIVAVAAIGAGAVLVGLALALRAVGSVAVPAAGRLFEPIVADVNVGILLVFGLASMSVYGITMAGWSSNNKYSLFGGIRSSAQMISYELSLTLAAIGALMAAGSLRLVDVVARQTGYFVLFDSIRIPAWNIIPMFFGFVVFATSGFAETNRIPFDLPEADAELVAGYHTEYSSMKFAMFFMSEYMAMATMSALIVTLFLGGWDIPWYREPANFTGFVLSALAFLLKVSFILFVFVWIRWTLPRFRYDQLMRLGWKVFLPLAILNIVIVAILIAYRWV